ncbi:MAG: DegV family protein [Oscillospiraceae bacterium]|nr:DegV family protein [Oscillospiraceae bacterium]MBR0211602.1 DegV family protein [Oscillospiraceae bacterium]
MAKIKVTCDSTCDLTQELYQKYDIHVVPLGITLGDTLYSDGVDIGAQEIFAYADAKGQLPKTSAVSPADYENQFRPFVEQGYEVIHINISSEFSACYQNACLAAAELGHVHPIDSRNLSTGSGHLAVLAAELAQQGLEADAIVAELERRKALLDVSFVLQRLDYLSMGGRCPGVVALGASLLKLRPEIRVVEGKMIVGKKYRGDAQRTILDYVKGRLEGRTDVDTRRIFITHAKAPQEIVDQVVALVRQLHPFEEVLVTEAGCTISSHCGPDCLGVLFFKKEA